MLIGMLNTQKTSVVQPRYGIQPALRLIYERGSNVSEASRRINVERKTLQIVLTGWIRPHPIVIVRLCDWLDITPAEAFTPNMLAWPSRHRIIPRYLRTGDYRPEFDERWTVFLSNMGWPLHELNVWR